MASASPYSCALTVARPHLTSPPFSVALLSPFKSNNPIKIPQLRGRVNPRRTAPVVKAEFDVDIFETDLESDDLPIIPPVDFPVLEDKEEPQCPPGLRKYETMVILRPDMSEDERLAFTQKYEELLVAGGGMYVEVYNRGVIPLAYDIKKRDKDGEASIYLDGIYLLFTYFTKPESMSILEETLVTDDNVIRSSSFRRRKNSPM